MKDLKDEFSHEYNAEVQKVFLSIIAGDVDLFTKCRTIILDKYFDDQFRPLVRFMLSHTDTYRSIPTLDMIAAKTGIKLSVLSGKQIELQRTWFCDDFEKFCRYRAMENVVLDGIELLRTGKADEVAQRAKDALTIRLSSDLGTDYFADPEVRLRRLMDNTRTVSTGWKMMDDILYGGFARGGLQIFLGNSGMGKSLVLQNLALNWALAGHNVIYFSLELDEDHTSLKIDAMLTGKGTREIVRTIADSAFMVTVKGKNAGRLHIKKYPGSGTNCNDFRAYIKEYEIINGHKPDAVIVDYLDLVYPTDSRIDPSNLFVKDKFVSEEIRALMDETNTFGATASQLTRGSIEAMGDYNQAHTAGGISKINTCDNGIALYAPPEFKEKGIFEFRFLKTRTSAGVGKKITLGYDNTCMRISDMAMTMNDVDKPASYDDLRKELLSKLEPEIAPSTEPEPDLQAKLGSLMAKRRAIL